MFLQKRLFESIKPLFHNKPLIIVVNKVDKLQLDELPEEKKELFNEFEGDENTPLIEMSTLTDFGVMDVKTQACEKLLEFRVDQKIKTKKVDINNPNFANDSFSKSFFIFFIFTCRLMES